MDYMAVVSGGVYPTPTPTDSVRSALAVSFGLLDFTLPGAIIVIGGFGRIVLTKIQGMFLSKDIYL